MKKLLNQPWFVATLAITALVMIAMSLREQFGFGPAPVRTAVASRAPDAPVPEDEPDAGGPEAHGAALSIPAVLASLVFPATLPDPFSHRGATLVAGDPEVVPGPAIPDVAEAIHVSALWTQAGASLALVNNRIVHAGDVIGRLTVAEISRDGVWVSHWKGRDFVRCGADFTLLTPATGNVASVSSP